MDAIHVCLNVSDADTTADWYCEELDFEYSWEFELEGTRNLYVADGNGFELQLSDTPEATPESGTAWDHLAVAVDDVDEAFDRIENHGVVQAPADNEAAGARTAFIEDPDGHVVELVQALSE